MKILYGVQGTGNGHISRANAISEVLSQYPDIEVDWLVSGRKANNLFQVQGKQLYRRGLTFSSTNGCVNYRKTMTSNNLFCLGRDVARLNLDQYDCLVTDYEPVLSWAARFRNKTTIGIGHQYAFNYKIPLQGDSFLSRTLLRKFAPADIGLGLHWHHFEQPILPPICDVPDWHPDQQLDHKVIVYLPFEDQNNVLAQLKPLTNYEFYVYSPDLQDADLGHIQTRSLSRQGFKDDLVTACAVITNSGFELISECLSMGIRVLTKPLHQQVEQLSNAAALRQLGYAQVVPAITTEACRGWLNGGEYVRVTYPRVHNHIAHWLASGQEQSVEQLSDQLWREVSVVRGNIQAQLSLAG
jgi:uncharacterized protein (TIGR00661 family)